jgi:hypothetical protein
MTTHQTIQAGAPVSTEGGERGSLRARCYGDHGTSPDVNPPHRQQTPPSLHDLVTRGV